MKKVVDRSFVKQVKSYDEFPCANQQKNCYICNHVLNLKGSITDDRLHLIHVNRPMVG